LRWFGSFEGFVEFFRLAPTVIMSYFKFSEESRIRELIKSLLQERAYFKRCIHDIDLELKKISKEYDLSIILEE